MTQEKTAPTIHLKVKPAYEALDEAIRSVGIDPDRREDYGMDEVVWMLNGAHPETFLAVVNELSCTIYYRGSDDELRFFNESARYWPGPKLYYFLWLGTKLCECDKTTAKHYIMQKRPKAGEL